MSKPDIITRIRSADRALARFELCVAAALVAALVLVLAAASVMRAAGRPLIWTDELSVLLMCAATFVGASSQVARRGHVAMTLLSGRIPGRAAALARDLIGLAVVCALSVLVWRWFDPVGLLRYGSAGALARETMNFIYADPTATLGLQKVWFWAALPAFCLGALFHAAVRVLESAAGRSC